MDLLIFTLTYVQAIAFLVNGAAINDDEGKTTEIAVSSSKLPPSVESPNNETPRKDEIIPKKDSTFLNIGRILGAAKNSFPDMSEDDLRTLISVLQLNSNAKPRIQDTPDLNNLVEEKPALYSNGPVAVPQIQERAVQQPQSQYPGCNSVPHETDPTRFYQLSRDGRQHAFPCAPGTVYNAVFCRCDWADASFVGTPFVGGNAVNQNGVVNVKPNVAWQTKWSGKCRTLMTMSFDNGIQDEAGFYTINHNVTLQSANGGNAGSFDGRSYIEAAVFTGNELGDTVDISFRFKPEINSARNEYEVLLSNECKRKWLVDGFLSSSIAFKYNPTSKDFRVSLETTSSALDGSCRPVPDGEGWFDVDLTLEKGQLITTVNGQTCFTSYIQGPITNKQCALGIGKSLTDDSTAFTGLIDEISIVKGCVQRR